MFYDALMLKGQVRSGINAWWEASDRHVGLTRHRMSLWINPNKADRSGWSGKAFDSHVRAILKHGYIGILLLDPNVNEGYPLWNGYGSLETPPSIHRLASSSMLTKTSLFESFLNCATSMSPEDITLLNMDPEYITSKIYPLIFSEWLVTLEFTFTGLFQIEWELGTEIKGDQRNLDDCLQRLYKWQRRLPFYTSWIKAAIHDLECRYLTDCNTAKYWHELIKDYYDIHRRMESMQSRADKTMLLAIAAITIDESKSKTKASHTVSPITYVAFIFIPMSFVSSFLSMNNDFNAKGMVYWVFFMIALPLSLTTFLLALYWEKIRQWWHRRLNGPCSSKIS